MKLSVFGLGYVGCVSAACFAARGHEVVGVDVDPGKVETINRGQAPVVEDRLGELTAQTVGSGALRATGDAAEAVRGSELSLVCVGTPSAPNGGIDTAFVERVSEQIGASLAEKEGRHTVVFRSTMLPGTCEERLLPLLERASGRTAGRDFGVCVNPEFLREGTGVRDFHDPPKTVVGELDEESGEPVAGLYDGLPGPRFRVRLPIAEMIKYADNAFHALKVGFANEIGALSRSLGLDSHELMQVFRADTKLNISPAYLSPGFAFGGSCLPKDLRAIVHQAGRKDVEVPILSSVLASNEAHLRRTFELIAASGRRRVGVLGLAFKSGTDDLRESPLVDLTERLLGKGYELRVYDGTVALSRLVGSNREYLDAHLPHLSRLLADSPAEVIDHAEVCIVGTREPDVVEALTRADGDRLIVDLVRLPGSEERRGQPGYVGVGW